MRKPTDPKAQVSQPLSTPPASYLPEPTEAGRHRAPPHLLEAVLDHLAAHVGHEPDDLLFPAHHGGHLAPSTLSPH